MKFGIYMVFLAVSCAGNALADARFSTDNQPPRSLSGLVYTQVQIDELTESDLRRLFFYADRATNNLQTLIEGASTRSVVEQDTANKRFRESISRLADAGARSGLSIDQVADFYTQNVSESFGQVFMQQVSVLAGEMDFRTLFRKVSVVPDPRTTVDDDGSAFLNALAEASQDFQPLSGASQTLHVVEGALKPQGPVALPNATAEEQSIVDRVLVNQGRWEITIQQGDSLSGIASAIYGDAFSFATIYDANAVVISNPNIIEVGTVLVLPKP